MNEHGATDEPGGDFPNHSSDVLMDMLKSMPSAGPGDSLQQFPPIMDHWCQSSDEPWSSVTAATVSSGPPSRLHHGTHSGRNPTLPRNVEARPHFFTGYRNQPPPSDCSTLPPGDKLPSDSGYGTVQSAPKVSIGNTSVFGDNNTDTQSLAGHLSNFGLQTNSLIPIDAFYNRRHWDFGFGVAAPGSQPAQQGANSLTCPHCPVPFKNKSQLKKHMQRHEKSHFCRVPGCSRKEGFSTQNDLDRHKRSKHPATHATGRRYRCHLGACKNKPKKWPRADNFRQHLKRRHMDEIECDDLEPFIVDEQPPSLNEVMDGEPTADTETEYQGRETLDVDFSDVGQDSGLPQNDYQATWAVAECTSDQFVEDDFHHDIGEQPHLSLEVPFDDASMMVGGQFTNFSPTTPDSQDVNLNAIDNTSHVDFDLGEFYTAPAAPGESPLTAENQLQGALTPTFSPRPEDLEFDDHDPFENHNNLYRDFSDLPRITVDMAEIGDDVSLVLESDDEHRRSVETLTDVCAHDDDDKISANNDEVPGDADAPGEIDSLRHSSLVVEPSYAQESDNDFGLTTKEGSEAISPVAAPLAEQHPKELEEGRGEDEVSGQSANTAFIETLKAGEYDKILMEHGYRKLSPPQAEARKTSSSVQTAGNPSIEGSGSVKCLEPRCPKTFNRDCELRKHMRRHEKPYGCTFRYCTKKFGSKSDWKRHENSQHEHLDGWRCDIQVSFPAGVTIAGTATTMQPCGRQCHRRETFRTHLQRDHGLPEGQLGEKLEQCHYGKEFGSRFWCGFCVTVVGVRGGGGSGISSRSVSKKVVDGGWSERYDHIDDHLFGRTFPKKRIDEWRHDEAEGAVVMATAPPSEVEEPAQRENEIEAYEQSRIKERERSSRRQRRATIKGDGSTPTHWQCCQCQNHNVIRVTTRCIGHEVSCEHDQCMDCATDHVEVVS